MNGRHRDQTCRATQSATIFGLPLRGGPSASIALVDRRKRVDEPCVIERGPQPLQNVCRDPRSQARSPPRWLRALRYPEAWSAARGGVSPPTRARPHRTPSASCPRSSAPRQIGRARRLRVPPARADAARPRESPSRPRCPTRARSRCCRRTRPPSHALPVPRMPCAACRCAAISAAESGANRTCGQRDRTVASSASGCAVTRTNTDVDGGSSSVFSSAFCAESRSVSASSMMTTRHRPSKGR